MLSTPSTKMHHTYVTSCQVACKGRGISAERWNIKSRNLRTLFTNFKTNTTTIGIYRVLGCCALWKNQNILKVMKWARLTWDHRFLQTMHALYSISLYFISLSLCVILSENVVSICLVIRFNSLSVLLSVHSFISLSICNVAFVPLFVCLSYCPSQPFI